MLSIAITLKVQELVLLASSLAVNVTVVSADEINVPGAGLCVMVKLLSQLSEAVVIEV